MKGRDVWARKGEIQTITLESPYGKDTSLYELALKNKGARFHECIHQQDLKHIILKISRLSCRRELEGKKELSLCP